MKVLKFGATSVGSAEDIKIVADIISGYRAQNTPIFVVVSAFGGVTNKLVDLASTALDGDQNYLVRLEELKIQLLLLNVYVLIIDLSFLHFIILFNS